MRPFLVVLVQPVIGDRAHLVDRLEHVRVEHFIAIGLVEAFDERVLIGLAGLDEAQLDPSLVAPLGECNRCQLAAVVQGRSACGFPYSSISCSITRITRRLGIECATSMPSTSRLPSSITLKVRKVRRL